ncbi:MAG: Flp family type IVb pilin [Geobacteraceae bacterium]|nr:Flp family type IVb pilin [Geobacteraceae bacterium]
MKRLFYRPSNPVCILKNSKGQTLVEYGLLLILIAVVVITAVTFLGQRANNTYSKIGNNMPQPPS